MNPVDMVDEDAADLQFPKGIIRDRIQLILKVQLTSG